MTEQELDRMKGLFAKYKLPMIESPLDSAFDEILDTLDAKLLSQVMVMNHLKSLTESFSRDAREIMDFVKINRLT